MLILHQAGMLAQSTVCTGNKFIVQSHKSDSIQTDFLYVDKNGKSYPIFLSIPNHKAFIVKWSEKKHKWYRRYLPRVTEELQKNDYGKSK